MPAADHPVLRGHRILIVGSPGSGKSTLAVKLHQRTGIPLIHLDNLWWLPDRTHITREEFDNRLADVLADEQWIIDGDYSRTYEVRIQACDTVIFLDYNEDVCLAGIPERIGKPRADIPWTENTPDPELLEEVLKYRQEKRPGIIALSQKYPHKHWIFFHARAQAEEWLLSL